MPLSDTACRAAKPDAKLRKLSDGGGLQLWIQPNGSRLWRMAYRYGGKQKLLSIGPYPEISLAEARASRDSARKLLRDNIDPSAAKISARRAKSTDVTFRDLVEGYLEKLRAERKAQATILKSDWVLGLVESRLGGLVASKIQPADVLDALLAIQKRERYESANRAKSTIGAVFRFAIANGKASIDPTAPLKGALIQPTRRPHPAILDPKALGALLRAIDGYEGHPTTIGALQLLPMVFTRPGELRAAEWDEFDLQSRTWTIPAAKTKMRRPLRVPLSAQAIEIVKNLQRLGLSSKYVFPSVRSNAKPMSENTINAALRGLGYDKDTVTAHGFRATASSLLNESNHWNADAIERQLGHVEANAVRAAYHRADHWPERVQMMQWWADRLAKIKCAGELLSLVAVHIDSRSA